MRKFKIGVLALIACLFLTGCGCTNNKLTEFTVTFDSNGGTSVSSVVVTKDEKVSEPTNPTKDGYTFDGWYLDGEKYDFSTPVTKDITLKAGWTKVAGGEVEKPKETLYTLEDPYCKEVAHAEEKHLAADPFRCSLLRHHGRGGWRDPARLRGKVRHQDQLILSRSVSCVPVLQRTSVCPAVPVSAGGVAACPGIGCRRLRGDPGRLFPAAGLDRLLRDRRLAFLRSRCK